MNVKKYKSMTITGKQVKNLSQPEAKEKDIKRHL